MRPRVKICCISSLKEAQLALSAGANALGLVSSMPSGPGVISEETIHEIISFLPSDIDTFLLTSKQDVDSIVHQYEKLRPKTIQIVDELKNGSLAELKKAIPEVCLVQVIHVQDENSIEEAIRKSNNVDAILLDSGNPNLKVKTLGGTGNTHNWEISKKIVQAVSKPVWLAGGLRPSNVVQAVQQVGPYGLDLCSGVRTNGDLDAAKLKAFFAAVDSAK